MIPGSPSFRPDGRSVALFLHLELHSEFGELFEGPSSAPATIALADPPGTLAFYTNTFVTNPGVTSATGARGDLAVTSVPNTGAETEVAVRLAGSTEWSRETLRGYSWPKALSVDGYGDTTLLANTFTLPGPTETASAYFAPPGGPFRALAVPGSYFTAIASDAAGRSAIAGYTSSGPRGPGLYLSRRESPYVPFGPPVLLSSVSRDTHPQLAYDAAGVLTVAWSEGSRVAVTAAAPGGAVGVTQFISAPGATAASDEQLSVDAEGEAVLTWSGGAHEEFGGWWSSTPGLKGVPAPVFATVRRSEAEPFQEVHELATSALYSAGLYAFRGNSEARAVDAISSGRAMVAWLEQGASGLEVKVALYAEQPGCASPPAALPRAQPPSPLSHPRLIRARHPHRHRRTLVLGYVSCPRLCAVTTSVFAGPPGRRHAIAHGSVKLVAHRRRTLTATLTKAGLRLLRARPRLRVGIDVRITTPGERPHRTRWTVRLAP